MRGGSNEVTVGERAWVNTCCYKSCYMCNVCKRIGAHFFGYGLECLEIKGSCICACTYDYNLRSSFNRKFSYLIVINSPCLTADTIAYNIIEYAGEIHPAAMAQMPAMCKIHPHNRIPGLKYSKIYCHIGLSTLMQLNIYMLSPKNSLCP